MAYRMNASGDYLRRSANLPTVTSYSACGYFYWDTQQGDWDAVYNLSDNTGTDYQIMYVRANAVNQWQLWSSNSNPTGQTEILASSTGNWYFWAITCTGTSAGELIGYAAGINDATLSSNTWATNAFTPTRLETQSTPFTEWGDGRHCAIKVWDAVLTQAELELERWYYAPVRRANLNTWLAGVHTSETTFPDLSGNGRDWTEGGTVTIEAGPPIMWSPSSNILLNHTPPAAPFDPSSGFSWPPQTEPYPYGKKVISY